MSRLCRQMSPHFTEKNLQTLHQRKIFTVLDFLREDLELLAQLLKLPFKELVQIRSSILVTYSAFPQQALNLYNDLVVNSALIPTGVDSLDALLEGGLLTGNLYELYGFSGAGKTQLCQCLSVNVSASLKQRVHFLDSCLAFSPARVRALLEARGCGKAEIRAVMERIKVTRVSDIYQVLSLLHRFKEEGGRQRQGNEDDSSTLRLIILDSLPPLFFPFLGGNLSEGLGVMNHFASLLKLVAQERHVAFVLVNISTRIHDGEPLALEASTALPPTPSSSSQVVGSLRSEERVKPALGKYWAHVPGTRLLLSKKGVCSGEVTVSVAKGAALPAGRSCVLTVSDKGFV